uniref:Methyltransferase-like protein 4 n=1 Tax=Clastoptera arizonana TaxID=38151 RepID=A0A1B6EAT1_9HEMI
MGKYRLIFFESLIIFFTFSQVYCINEIFNKIIQCAKKFNFLNFNKTEQYNNNADAREISERFFKNLSSYKNASSSGSNTNDYAIATNCFDDLIIFPANSIFYCCDVKELFNKLESNRTFDFILMDPPWWNKYIRRKNLKNVAEGYKMMYNHELKELPIKSFLCNDGLLAIWCTNSSSHVNDVINILFPNWGIEYCATWYWMKVTKSGEPVCNFSKPPGKQPYERIIFGSRSGRTQKYRQPEEKKVIISVPSAIHSHKPPLIEVLASYLPTHPACLELFARYLLPNWTSCGNQVMCLQNMDLFTQESTSLEPS